MSAGRRPRATENTGGGRPIGARRAAAQPRRVGVLAPSTPAKEEVTLQPFFEAMRELGWVERQTVVYERFFADDRHDRLPALAAELVSRGPEVIYAPPSSAAVAAARATSAIPVVFASLNDPVGLGIVKSLAEPGGNVTGVATIGADLGPKRLELLKELLPAVRSWVQAHRSPAAITIRALPARSPRPT